MNEKVILALAETNRLQIIEMLRERPLSVQELTGRLPISQPQVSKHLRTLSEAGLVNVYPVAQQRYYGIDPNGMKKIFAWAESFTPLWDTKSEIAHMYLRAVRAKQAHIPTKAQPFIIERIIAAPRQLVWEAWTVPVLLAQWFAPDYFSVPVCELDVRPGGALRIDLQAPDGTVYPMTGTYQKVEAMETLRTVQSPLDESGKKMFELELTVRFSDEGMHTRVAVEASVLSATSKAAPHLAGLRPGWEQNLANLNRMLAESTMHKEAG